MKPRKLEPGILQVFRLYAILRILLVVLSSIAGNFFSLSLRPGSGPNRLPESDPVFSVLIIGIEMGVLLAYLSIPWFQRKLKGAFLPIGLIFASAVILTEPLISVHYGQIWSAEPFLYLLVILIAWQYDFIWVLVFAAAAIGFDFLIRPNEIVQRQLSENMVEINMGVYLAGKNFLRTASFLIISFVVTHLSKAQRTQRDELIKANRSLLRHNVTLEQLTISRERNRLSRELHDTLAHSLSAMTVQLDAITTIWEQIPTKVQGMLTTMLETTRSGLDETRRALHSLRASPLEDMGLSMAVNMLAADIAERYSLSYQHQLETKLESLSPEIEQCFYRVAQEALENIARHAEAENFTISLRIISDELVLEISDDGIGVSETDLAQDTRLGIKGMQERAEQINAALDIEGKPEQGTTVRLVKGIKQ
ncbi:MAG: sensor histidine kinase [Chloroflexota bacterium]